MSNGNKRVNKKVHCFVGDHLAPDLSSAPHAFLFQQDSSPCVLRCENSDCFSFSLLKFSKVQITMSLCHRLVKQRPAMQGTKRAIMLCANSARRERHPGFQGQFLSRDQDCPFYIRTHQFIHSDTTHVLHGQQQPSVKIFSPFRGGKEQAMILALRSLMWLQCESKHPRICVVPVG